MKTRPLLLLCTLLLGAHTLAVEVAITSSEQQATLVELFTSEGCSSCPPAEAWLSSLRDDARLWKEVVPVAFHVTYWDHLGWRDQAALPQFTQRQRAYAEAWKGDGVYTPNFALNGRDWRGWFDQHRLPSAKRPLVGTLTVRGSYPGPLTVAFHPADSTGVWQAHVALLASGLSTEVKAGENQGRNLPHDFVAQRLEEASLERVGSELRAEVKLPALATGRPAVAVWVTAKGSLQPVQAAGGWLAPQ